MFKQAQLRWRSALDRFLKMCKLRMSKLGLVGKLRILSGKQFGLDSVIWVKLITVMLV